MDTRSIVISDEIVGQDDLAKLRSAQVRQFGSDLSERLNCPADILYVHEYWEALGRRHSSLEEQRKVIEKDKEKFAPLLKELKNPGKLVVKLGIPVNEIIKHTRQNHKLEALVMGSRSRVGLEHFFLGSVAEEVVRSIKRPIFILGPEAQKAQYRLASKKELTFLVATDLSKKCRAVETYAVSLAQKLGAKIVFYYSLADSLDSAQQYVNFSGEVISSFDSIFEDIKKEAFDGIKKKAERVERKGVKTEWHVEENPGTFVETLLNGKGKEADLIFMGNQTYGSFVTALLGSNVRDAIGKAKVPVVIVRS